jgi:hypothetical protein
MMRENGIDCGAEAHDASAQLERLDLKRENCVIRGSS